MIKLIFAGSVSACFEFENESPYYNEEAYDIFIGDTYLRTERTNVFSVFGLKPGTEYVIRTVSSGISESCRFTTEAESCVVDVRSCGAVGDGIHEDTSAIQTALDSLPLNGRVFFPAGTYLTLPLRLKSHITLEFAEDAVLLGSTDRERYPVVSDEIHTDDDGNPVWFAGFEGCIKPMYRSLISADYVEDITIVGPGMVDGNAQNSDFWTEFENFPMARPRLMFFNHCKNVTVHGITACNSPSWHFHPYYSENVRLLDIYVQAPKDSPNTDAMNPESCDMVEIIGCRFSVGDDCVAIKSGKIEMVKDFYKPASRHTVRNCLMEFGHGAVTLGSEMACGLNELKVSKCFFRNTERGLRIKTRRGRGKGCDLSGVVFENIRMDGVFTPVVINMWYNCCDPDRHSEYVWSRKCLPVDDRTPHLGDFCFRNIICTDTHAAACYIDGLPERPVDSVSFENFRVSFAADAIPFVPASQEFAKPMCKAGMHLKNVKEVLLKDVSLYGVDGEALITDNCGELHTENFISE